MKKQSPKTRKVAAGKTRKVAAASRPRSTLGIAGGGAIGGGKK